MKVLFDSTSEVTATVEEVEGHALNYVEVIIQLEGGRERHIKVTDEGIITEIVENGEVISDLCIEHEEMLPE